MAISAYPQKIPQKNVVTLTSGSSWTVPSNVTSITVTLIGGGGGAQNGFASAYGAPGGGGQKVVSTLSTTPGASISYSIGAGGNGYRSVGGVVQPQNGGNTTFTGATTANGGIGGKGPGAQDGDCAVNGGASSAGTGDMPDGRPGMIYVEYWL